MFYLKLNLLTNTYISYSEPTQMRATRQKRPKPVLHHPLLIAAIISEPYLIFFAHYVFYIIFQKLVYQIISAASKLVFV